MIPSALSEAFAFQGQACVELGSPFMGQLCRLLSTREWPETSLRERYFAWSGDIGPNAQSLPLRLAGGFHALVLTNDPLEQVYPPNAVEDDVLWRAICDAMLRQDAFLNDWVDSPPQTNEVRRAAVLIAVGQLLANKFKLPMRVSELGASGGLNLMFDQFAVKTNGGSFGATDPSLTLTPEWSGPLPPTAAIDVQQRQGVDLTPLNPRNQTDAMRLRAYLWPDQPERLTRTNRAIAANDVQVEQADAIDWLANKLDHKAGQLHLIYHTVAWQYFPDDVQAKGTDLIEQAGKHATVDAPLAWFGMEADGQSPGAALTLRLWPGEIRLALGRADFHGRWINWTYKGKK
mgnify:CR=1 FL=1